MYLSIIQLNQVIKGPVLTISLAILKDLNCSHIVISDLKIEDETPEFTLYSAKSDQFLDTTGAIIPEYNIIYRPTEDKFVFELKS